MESVSIKPGEKAEMKCHIYGYPQSKVIWSFIPCEHLEFNSQSCNDSRKMALTVSVTKSQTFEKCLNFIIIIFR